MKNHIIAAVIIFVMTWSFGHDKTGGRLPVISGSVKRLVHSTEPGSWGEVGSAPVAEQTAEQKIDEPIPAVDPDKVMLELALDPLAIPVDVRMRFEYRKGHIEKAVHLPGKKDLDEFATKTEKHRPLYVYCTTETRARQAAQLLIDHGFEKVFVIEGGISKWKAYKLPLIKGRQKTT
jgi:rhodanese-related sulfurtransferase